MKKFLFLFVVALTALQMSAADVTTAQAQAAASAFIKKQVNAGRLKASAATNLQLVKAEASVAKPSAVDYYIFNSARSYVVVAGDDQAPQILMYGEEGALDLNNIPPAMEWLLNKYKYQIDGLKAGTLAPAKQMKFATTPVEPLVSATWDQGSPYNNQCPSSYGSRSYTGCPATSLAMCYYKWKWPETLPACAALSGTGGASASALSERAADWDNIIDHYGTWYDDNGSSHSASYSTAQSTAVAWLMRYAGQSIPDYYYSSYASGANDPEIYQGVLNMGYTDAEYLLLTEYNGYSNGSQQYTDAQWNEWMLNELHNGRPIEYLAYDSKNSDHGGHAFNVFGVDSNGKYYVNWGWSGQSNGYCTLHNFTTSNGATSGSSGSYIFNWGEAMIIGIEPPAGVTTTPRITVNPATLTMNTTVGTPVTATFTVTGANLTGNVNLSVSGNTAFSLNKTSITATQATNGTTVTVTYNPDAVGTHEATVTLTSTDAESVTVKLNGIAEAAPLETYPPVMLEASNITSTSFTASWTDQTPAANVENYTLYVSAEPFTPAIAQLDSLDGSKYTGSYANITLSAPWGGTNVKGGNGAVYTSGSSGKITYTIPAGYQNATFSFQVTTTSTNYGSGNITVGSTQTSAVGYTMAAGETHTWVVTASAGETITLTSTDASYSPDIAMIRVYSGNTTVASYKMAETGDATYRVITGITSKSYTVNNLTEGGTFYFYVVANYANGTIANSNTEQVTLLENTNPTITVNPAALDMTANVGETVTATFNVSGANLTGNVNLTLNDANGVYSISPSSIRATDAMNGTDVTVTYAPTAYGSQTATIILRSTGAEDVTVNLNGTATLVKETPVMLPADESYINLTKFRADWTDATPEANVSSYTLEVSTKSVEPEPEPELIASLSGTQFSGNNYYTVTLTAPWSGTNTRGHNNEIIYFRNNYNNDGSYGSISYTVPAGYENATFTMKITTGTSTEEAIGNLTVATPQTAAVTHYFSPSETYAWVVTASSGDKITITTPDDQYSPDIALVEVYSGNATTSGMKKATETGDATYRLIEGITNKFYTVENLTAEGTFLYKVKALYLDGTESDWSNIEEVTLFANDNYQLGDVNHDGSVDIDDVTMLINKVLGNNPEGFFPAQANCDCDADGKIDIDDVTALINRVLTGEW